MSVLQQHQTSSRCFLVRLSGGYSRAGWSFCVNHTEAGTMHAWTGVFNFIYFSFEVLCDFRRSVVLSLFCTILVMYLQKLLLTLIRFTFYRMRLRTSNRSLPRFFSLSQKCHYARILHSNHGFSRDF